MKKQISFLIVIGTVVLLPLSTFANTKVSDTLEVVYNISKLKPYIGLNFVYGNTKFYDNFGDFISELSDRNIETGSFFNTNNFGFSLNVGSQISRYLAIEGFFQQIYSGEKTKNIEYKLDSYSNQHIGIKTKQFDILSFGIDIVGYLPINHTRFSLMGSLGAGYYGTSFKITTEAYEFSGSWTGTPTKQSGTETEDNLGFRFGLGAQYAFSETWAIRSMIRYVKMDSDKENDVLNGIIDISTGLRYAF